MKISTMRAIDYWVGIPICFVLTGVKNILCALLPKPSNLKNEKILLIELSEMGSFILAYPGLQALQNNHPKASIHFLTFKRNLYAAELLREINPEKILTLRDESLFLFIKDLLKLLFHFLKTPYLATIDLELFSRFTSILTFLSGAQKKIGFYRNKQEGLYRGNLLTHPIYYNEHQHMKDNLFQLMQATVLEKTTGPFPKCPPKNIDYQLPKWKPINLSSMSKRLKENSIDLETDTVILIKAGGGVLPIRAWPLSNFTVLVERLLTNDNVKIILIGTEEDTQHHLKLKSNINSPKIIDWTSQTSLNELLDLFTLSHLLITNDGGPAHFASLTRTPSIVFFGPETPKLYAPLGNQVVNMYTHFHCSPCLTAFNHRHSTCQDNQCLKIISPDDVMQKVDEILKK